jgi:hypothetical protein
MRPRRLVPFLAILAATPATPATAQIPISGVGDAGGAEMAAMRRWLGRTDDRPDRTHNRQRGAELAGQIGRLYRRIDDLRDSGRISRAEARAMRREAARAALFYSTYRGGGISDSEAAELQNRIYVADSLVRRSQPPARR